MDGYQREGLIALQSLVKFLQQVYLKPFFAQLLLNAVGNFQIHLHLGQAIRTNCTGIVTPVTGNNANARTRRGGGGWVSEGGIALDGLEHAVEHLIGEEVGRCPQGEQSSHHQRHAENCPECVECRRVFGIFFGSRGGFAAHHRS
jgi:hypothetical protein